MTVAPRETLTHRLFSASAIGLALALFGVLMLPMSEVRALVSPWLAVGATSASTWLTLRRWAVAVREGRLFRVVRPSPVSWSPRRIAERAATTVASYAIPVPGPPDVVVDAFRGAALAH